MIGGTPPAPYDRYKVSVPGLKEILESSMNTALYMRREDAHIVLQDKAFSAIRGRLKEMADGEILRVGRLEFTFIHTSGHTQGSQSILLSIATQESDEVIGMQWLFAGDTLFADGLIGRCDLPGGNLEDMRETIVTKLMPLPDSVVLCPGHSYGNDLRAANLRRILTSGKLKEILKYQTL